MGQDPKRYFLVVPEPPPTNQVYRRAAHGKMYMTAKGHGWKEQIGWICKADHCKPLLGDIAIKVSWYRGAKRGDLDGRLKLLFDALEGYCYENDKQITEIHAFRREDKENPRMVVEVQKA